MNQIERSGSSFFYARFNVTTKSSQQRPASNLVLALVLCLSLFLVGSCNERAAFTDLAAVKPDLSVMEKSDLLRYAYALQAGLMNAPQDIGKLRTSDIHLVLASPDLERADGAARVWQYRTNLCVLDIHWRATEAQSAVKHHEFRARQIVSRHTTAVTESTSEPLSCIQSIIQERRAEVEQNLFETYAVLSLNAHKS
jgi:hypothetical protein